MPGIGQHAQKPKGARMKKLLKSLDSIKTKCHTASSARDGNALSVLCVCLYTGVFADRSQISLKRKYIAVGLTSNSDTSVCTNTNKKKALQLTQSQVIRVPKYLFHLRAGVKMHK